MSRDENNLKNIIESNDCPPYARKLAAIQLETKNDIRWLKCEIEFLKRLNMWQVGLLASILISILVTLISKGFR